MIAYLIFFYSFLEKRSVTKIKTVIIQFQKESKKNLNELSWGLFVLGFGGCGGDGLGNIFNSKIVCIGTVDGYYLLEMTKIDYFLIDRYNSTTNHNRIKRCNCSLVL
jgi:hypothetical protein